MTEFAIEVAHVSKKYRIGRRKSGASERWIPSLGDVRAWLESRRDGSARPDPWIWALKDVSFRIARGESWGIIGRNGSGKTTLLKIIAGITAPTSGTFQTSGSLAAMLSLGTGFNMELTGRENVYLSAAIRGLSRREVDARFDEIVEFSGIGDFMDTPVKRYSSGMRVRLGFSISMNIQPDILLLDEVFAAGDYEFRQKAVQRMKEFRDSGRTILFVSHNVAAVKAFCEKAIWLDQGCIRTMGNIDDVVRSYLQSARPNLPASVSEDTGLRHEGTGEAQIVRFQMFDASGNETTTFMHGDPVTFRVAYVASEPIRYPIFSINISRVEDNVTAMRLHSGHDMVFIEAIEGEGVVEVTIPNLWLMPGDYRFVATISRSNNTLDRVRGIPPMTIIPGPLLSRSTFKFDSTDMVMFAPVEWRCTF